MGRPGFSRLTEREVSWMDWIKPLSWGWTRWPLEAPSGSVFCRSVIGQQLCTLPKAPAVQWGKDIYGRQRGTLWPVWTCWAACWVPGDDGDGDTEYPPSSLQETSMLNVLVVICCSYLWSTAVLEKQSCICCQNFTTEQADDERYFWWWRLLLRQKLVHVIISWR